MSKKLILSILLIVAMILASSSVLALKKVNITDTEVFVSGVSGDKTGTITVENIGDEKINVSFQPTIHSFQTHTLELTDFDTITELNPGSQASANFEVNLDKHAGNYSGAITAVIADASNTDAVMSKVEVQYNGETISVTPSIINSVQTDTVFNQVIDVTNNANKDLVATIARTDYDGLGFTLIPEGTYTFPALQTTKVTATVVVPSGAANQLYTSHVNFTVETTPKITELQTIVQPTYKINVPQLTITADPGSSTSGNMVISNTGNINLTGLTVTSIPSFTDNDGDKINLTASPNSSISVNVGKTANVNVVAAISQKMDSGVYTGTMTVSGGGVSKDVTVSIQVRDILQIIDIDISEDDVKPGEKIDIEVEVENIAEDVDLKDVEIEIYFLDGSSKLEDDDDDDIEEESEEFKLDAGDSKKITLEFTIPYGVSDGDSFAVHIEARGKNKDDTSEKYSVIDESSIISVEKEDHKLEFFDIRLDSDTLSCSRSTYLRVGVRNIGDSDEDDVELAVTNSELGLSKHVIFDIENDPEDDEFEVEKSFLLNLQDAPIGSYDIQLKVYYDDDDETEEDSIALNIARCSGSGSSSDDNYVPPSTPTGSDDDVQFTYTGPSDSGATPVSAVAPRISSAKPKSSLTDSSAFLVLIGLANVLLIIIIIVAVVMLVKK